LYTVKHVKQQGSPDEYFMLNMHMARRFATSAATHGNAICLPRLFPTSRPCIQNILLIMLSIFCQQTAAV
jgi:hypothetical protein